MLNWRSGIVLLILIGGMTGGCGPGVALEDSDWQLVELKGQPTKEGIDGLPSLHLKSEGKLAQGSGGCNRFTGSYELEGDSLKFGPMASTRMFCEEVMDQEQAYLQVLAETTRYKAGGRSLELYSGDELLARLSLDKLP